MMSIGATTFWLVVTNIALGAFTVGFWLVLILVVIREIVERRRHGSVIQGIGSGRIYVSESGMIRGLGRGNLEGVSRN